MPVPTLVTDLSTTLASNSPSGSDNVFPDLDNYLRAMSGFIASIRDNSGNGWVSPYLPLTYSAGTANGVVYLNGSKVVTTGSALVFDGTNFSTTGTATATKLIPTGGSATGNGMYLPAANTLAWSTNGAETMRLDSSGNLGLGVTPSANAYGSAKTFFVSGDSANGLLALSEESISATSQYVSLMNNAYPDGAGVYKYKKSSQVATSYRQNDGAHSWFTAPSGTAGNAISFTQAMTLTAAGRLGVGVTAPNYTFETAFDAAVTAGSCTALLSAEGGAQGSVGTTTNHALLLKTNNTERARITSGGALVVGNTAVAGFEVLCASNNSALAAPFASWNRATSSDNIFAGWYTEGTATIRGTIDYNRAGGLVRYNTTSDYRAKDIIGPVQNPGATIDALKVYEGRMKGASQSRPMLIAHEAQAHVPFCVSGEKDEENPDGSPKFQQMDHASLVPLLLAEIQSLRARVAALEQA